MLIWVDNGNSWVNDNSSPPDMETLIREHREFARLPSNMWGKVVY